MIWGLVTIFRQLKGREKTDSVLPLLTMPFLKQIRPEGKEEEQTEIYRKRKMGICVSCPEVKEEMKLSTLTSWSDSHSTLSRSPYPPGSWDPPHLSLSR